MHWVMGLVVVRLALVGNRARVSAEVRMNGMVDCLEVLHLVWGKLEVLKGSYVEQVVQELWNF